MLQLQLVAEFGGGRRSLQVSHEEGEQMGCVFLNTTRQ
jgi:hypothetical protein